jgi:hypothetical protein
VIGRLKDGPNISPTRLATPSTPCSPLPQLRIRAPAPRGFLIWRERANVPGKRPRPDAVMGFILQIGRSMLASRGVVETGESLLKFSRSLASRCASAVGDCMLSTLPLCLPSATQVYYSIFGMILAAPPRGPLVLYQPD